MSELAPSLNGLPALRERSGNHPYINIFLQSQPIIGYERGGALVWSALGPWGPAVAALGDAEDALALIADLMTVGAMPQKVWAQLPRQTVAAAGVPLELGKRVDWDLLWLTQPASVVEGGGVVVELGAADYPYIDMVLDAALPDTTRPGEPGIRQWSGIREGDRLVAVAADRSVNAQGFLSSIAVAPDRQGRGLGALLTSVLSHRLHAEFGVVALAVMADNEPALRLYRRLGFEHSLRQSSIRLRLQG